MSRFVTPETVRLPISCGDFVDVKKRLTHGEQEDFNAAVGHYVDGAFQINRRMVRDARVLTYLVGWSLQNQGVPVPMSPDLTEQQRLQTIGSLEAATFDEIHDAIFAHEVAIEAASKEAEKNGPSAPVRSDAT